MQDIIDEAHKIRLKGKICIPTLKTFTDSKDARPNPNPTSKMVQESKRVQESKMAKES